jgi:acetyl esterase/lipase
MNHLTHPLASRPLFVVVTLFVLAVGASEVRGQRQAEALRALDKNGDKAISKEEAGETLWKRFSKRDANGDGKLTETEIRNRGGNGKTAATPEANAPETNAPEPPDFDEKFAYKKVGDTSLWLYAYQPKGHQADAQAPAIVFFFGGAWKNGSPGQFAHHCQYFAQRGMVAITVEYRVSSRHSVKIEDCIEDAKSAMRWVRGNAKQLGIDPDRIASGGGSAGGHLAACVSLIDDFDAKTDDQQVSPLPNAMVLFNPFMGLADIGDVPESSRTRGPYEKVFPLTYATKKQPPCVMFFGTADRLLSGAELFRQKSVEAGNDCNIVTWEGQGHGFFNHGKADGKYYNLTVAEAEKFLSQLGWLKPQAD